MQNWAPLWIGIATGGGIGLAFWGIFYVLQDTSEFLTKEEALSITKHQYQYPIGGHAYFGFLKYNGTNNGPRFLMYPADPHTEQILGEGHAIIFDSDHFGQYLSHKMSDRFVWAYTEGYPGAPTYFVDASNGELVGRWSGCPGCVCHHSDKTK